MSTKTKKTKTSIKETDTINLSFGRFSIADIELITKFDKNKQRVKWPFAVNGGDRYWFTIMGKLTGSGRVLTHYNLVFKKLTGETSVSSMSFEDAIAFVSAPALVAA